MAELRLWHLLLLSLHLSVYTYPQRGNNNDRVAITLEYLTASLCCYKLVIVARQQSKGRGWEGMTERSLLVEELNFMI